MSRGSFKIIIVLLLFAKVCFSQAETVVKPKLSKNVYFEFKPVSGVFINSNSKDTAFYELDKTLGLRLNYALFYCKVTKDSLVVSLPYANQSYSREANLANPGIKFISKTYSYDLVTNNDDSYKVNVKTKDLGLENYILSFVVKGNSAFCIARSTKKEMIGFFGKIKKV